MTSNIGIKEVAKVSSGVGFETEISGEQNKRVVADVFERELKNKFPPEFLNRISDIITFNTLTPEDIAKIVVLETKIAVDVIAEINYKVLVKKPLLEQIAEIGYDKEYGARPLKRAIQHLIKDSVADAIIDYGAPVGSTITLSYNKATDKVTHKITKK